MEITSDLHRAAFCGNDIEVKRLLENIIDVNVTDLIGYTALHVAAKFNSISAVKLLLEHGANIEVTATDHMCPLHLACIFGHLEIVKLLKGFGANMTRRSKSGNYPIHLATIGGHIAIMKYFVDNGVDLNTTLNNFGSSVLHIAATSGNIKAVQFLLKCNIDINIKDHCECTALYCAVRKGDIEIVKLLINKGADINYKNYEDWSPLHVGAEKGHFDIVKLLFEKGAFCDFSKVYKNKTPLCIATQYGRTDIVAYFLDNGANVESQALNGYTLLHIAAQFGHLDIVKLLLEKGANIHSRIHNIGTTPLHYAADRVWLHTIEYLILNGADVTAKEVNQNMPLDKIFSASNLRQQDLHEQILMGVQILVKHMLLRNKETKILYPPNYIFQKLIEDFHEKCLKEIDLMNMYMIGDTTISLYKFLHDMFDETKLAIYLYNTHIKQEMENPYNHIKHFLIYLNIDLLIEHNVNKAINRQCLLDKANDAINCLNTKLPLESKIKIFSYLNCNDLNNFVNALDLS